MTTTQSFLADIYHQDEAKAQVAKQKIINTAFENNIFPASIQPLYHKISQDPSFPVFTVPACNLRGLTYDTARVIFSSANALDVGPFVFEIARSETVYTRQSPQTYVAQILAAAIDEEWQGPVFFQADHMQPKAKSPGVPAENEIENLKNVIRQYVEAGFYNIDIDTSTLVDTQKPTIEEQQQPNIAHTLMLLQHAQEISQSLPTLSFGGEIGHIGGSNSTSHELRVFLDGLQQNFQSMPLTKVAIQNGTAHGGTMNKDGQIEPVDIDFSLHQELSQLARSCGLAGTVQHGASTISDNYYNQFPSVGTIEIHLATGIQNLIFDHPNFPPALLNNIYTWMDQTLQKERKEDWNDTQFHYKLRKKSWGFFQNELASIPENAKISIMDSVETRFLFFFHAFHLPDTYDLLECIQKPKTALVLPTDTYFTDVSPEVSGLSD